MMDNGKLLYSLRVWIKFLACLSTFINYIFFYLLLPCSNLYLENILDFYKKKKKIYYKITELQMILLIYWRMHKNDINFVNLLNIYRPDKAIYWYTILYFS